LNPGKVVYGRFSRIRDAAIELYEAYRPVRNAFDDFSNDLLVTVVKSLGPKTEKFSPPRVMKFSEMVPVLFVEEPPNKAS
jgi:hypothetical protein